MSNWELADQAYNENPTNVHVHRCRIGKVGRKGSGWMVLVQFNPYESIPARNRPAQYPSARYFIERGLFHA